MKLFVAGLSYKTAPVAVRERLAVQPARLRCHGCRLKLGGGLSEGQTIQISKGKKALALPATCKTAVPRPASAAPTW